MDQTEALGDKMGMAHRSNTGIPSGRLGMWWLLVSEIVIFGGLLGVYTLMRLSHPEWAEEAAHTNTWIGAINTLVLLTGSLTVIYAFIAAEKGDGVKSANYLLLSCGCGLLFLVFKIVFEYTPEIIQGYTPVTNIFWSFYYLATALHGLHVLAGVVAMYVISLAVRKGQNLQRVEYVGIYWHFVDAVWLFLFPLFYIAQ